MREHKHWYWILRSQHRIQRDSWILFACGVGLLAVLHPHGTWGIVWRVLACIYIALALPFLLPFKDPREGRSWTLWNVGCRRGRICGGPRDGLVVEQAQGEFSPGTLVVITYACARCGTCYRREWLIGSDGAYTTSDRVEADA